MLIRSFALSVALFFPTNFPPPPKHVTVIAYNPAPIKWLQVPKITDRVPVEVVTAPKPVIATSIIPEAKPEKPILIKSPKPDTGLKRCWRTLANGHRKYRLRRTC